jgi:hypothetical protein
MIQSYESTSLTDWRAMGDDQSDSYDPDMYQKLWAIDEMMAKAGVSYKKGDLNKQKFSAKAAGSGRAVVAMAIVQLALVLTSVRLKLALALRKSDSMRRLTSNPVVCR